MGGLDVDDGEEPPVFTKAELGVEILNILRLVLEDELHCYLTDSRFLPHATMFGRCNLGLTLRKEHFKTADQETMTPISIRNMSLRQRQHAGTEQVMERVTRHQF